MWKKRKKVEEIEEGRRKEEKKKKRGEEEVEELALLNTLGMRYFGVFQGIWVQVLEMYGHLLYIK